MALTVTKGVMYNEGSVDVVPCTIVGDAAQAAGGEAITAAFLKLARIKEAVVVQHFQPADGSTGLVASVRVSSDGQTANVMMLGSNGAAPAQLDEFTGDASLLTAKINFKG